MTTKKAPIHKLSSKMPKTPPVRIEGKDQPTGEWEDGKYYLIQYMGHVIEEDDKPDKEIVTSSERTGDYRQGDLFVFHTSDGEEWQLPVLDNLTIETSEWLESPARARMGYITATRALIAKCNEDAAQACIDTGMTRSRLEQVSMMWSRAGEVSVGESVASDDS